MVGFPLDNRPCAVIYRTLKQAAIKRRAMQLTDAKVVILGGSTGIGFATAKAASAEGARVTIAGRSPEKLKQARAALGNKIETAALDVNDETAVRDFFAARDGIDHIFITAGNPAHAPRLEI